MNAPDTGSAGPPSGGGSGHAALETLVSYLRGELPDEEAERLREHLVGCAQCVELLLDLEAFERGAEDGTAGERDRETSWERMRAARPWRSPGGGDPGEPAALLGGEAPRPRLGRRSSRPAAGPGTDAGYAPPRRPPHFGTGALLAASLAVTLGLCSWSIHLQRRQAAPHPDHAIVDLHVPAVTRSGDPGREPAPVPPGAAFTAVIHPDVDAGYPSYEAAIVDAAGATLWRGRLTPAEPDAPYLTLGLSRRLLEERSYTIRLWGVDGDRRVPAGEYPLEFAD